MSANDSKFKIKIVKNGPYLVVGGAPLTETVITPKGDGYVLKPGRELPQGETYALCRCGRSQNAPFCDGAHAAAGFRGDETADRTAYRLRAKRLKGPGVDLLDDGRCAFARFCHRESGDVWELTLNSSTEEIRNEAIRAAAECPAGRLTAMDKDGTVHEPEYQPAIEIMQDPQSGVSAGIFVKGGIPVESADGATYEVRSRVVLCRCGKSRNKPFCDAAHVTVKYLDK